MRIFSQHFFCALSTGCTGAYRLLGDRTICVFFGANETSICRYSLAFIFSEIIFESGMTKRHSHHYPQFRKPVNSSEFSISDGSVCSKAGDSVLYKQSLLAGFPPLILQPGINYPPTYNTDRADNFMEINNFIML